MSPLPEYKKDIDGEWMRLSAYDRVKADKQQAEALLERAYAALDRKDDIMRELQDDIRAFFGEMPK